MAEGRSEGWEAWDELSFFFFFFLSWRRIRWPEKISLLLKHRILGKKSTYMISDRNAYSRTALRNFLWKVWKTKGTERDFSLYFFCWGYPDNRRLKLYIPSEVYVYEHDILYSLLTTKCMMVGYEFWFVTIESQRGYVSNSWITAWGEFKIFVLNFKRGNFIKVLRREVFEAKRILKQCSTLHKYRGFHITDWRFSHVVIDHFRKFSKTTVLLRKVLNERAGEETKDGFSN